MCTLTLVLHCTGLGRVWSSDGKLLTSLKRHEGPIFSLKWNKRGDYLLSGSVDKTAIIWNAESGKPLQQFSCQEGATLDVDWRDNESFASCSTDKNIYVCQLGESEPLHVFKGHTVRPALLPPPRCRRGTRVCVQRGALFASLRAAPLPCCADPVPRCRGRPIPPSSFSQNEVNAVKWDPTGSLLASCSDDKTAKIWKPEVDKEHTGGGRSTDYSSGPVVDLSGKHGHTKEIYTLKWSPTGVSSLPSPPRALTLPPSPWALARACPLSLGCFECSNPTGGGCQHANTLVFSFVRGGVVRVGTTQRNAR